MLFLTLAVGILLGVALGSFVSALEVQRGDHKFAPRGYKQSKEFARNYWLVGLALLAIWLAVAIPTHMHLFSWPTLIGAAVGMRLLDLIESKLLSRFIWRRRAAD